MLGLPRSTEIKRILPKNTVYAILELNAAARERFDADIRQITLVNEVSPGTVAVSAGEQVSGFYVAHIALKRRGFDPKNLLLLAGKIPQNLLFYLDHGDRAALAVCRQGKLLQTPWRTPEELTLRLTGLDLDAMWENIIVQVGRVELSEGNTLDQQLQADREREKLLKQIAALEKKLAREKQPKKKFELHQEILKLKKELE